MKDNLGFPDGRSVDRLRTKQLASYIRYDRLGQPCEQTTVELIGVSLKGVRLQSGSLLSSHFFNDCIMDHRKL
jgi:hypothetical protein